MLCCSLRSEQRSVGVRLGNKLKMSRLIQPPPKFTPEEWHRSNHLNYNNAEKERKLAERIRDESLRLQHETNVTTTKTQNDVNKKFEQRIGDLGFWKSELDRQNEETQREIGEMIKYKERLENALAATELPLHIVSQCLVNRERRIGVDLVHDDVEIQLLKEIEIIEGVQALLRKTLEQAIEQIRLLRSAKYYLDKDINDKFSALTIDNTCSSLKNDTPNTYYAPTAVKIETNSVTPDEWESFSNKNVLKSERERNSSLTLRSMIDEILQETFNDQMLQFDTVNLALKKRIEETEKAKISLEDHLKKVMEEIKEMEDNIERLQNAINEKQKPMKVAQTRLDQRTYRPNIELCRDRVQYRLVGEVSEITLNIERLQEMLAASDLSLKALIRQQLNLEEDIDIKANSLVIDRDQNVELRKQIDHKQY